MMLKAAKRRYELREQVKLFPRKLAYGAVDDPIIELLSFMVAMESMCEVNLDASELLHFGH